MRCEFEVIEHRVTGNVHECVNCGRRVGPVPAEIHTVVRKCTARVYRLGDAIERMLRSIGITPERFAYWFGAWKISGLFVEYVPVKQRRCGCGKRKEALNRWKWVFTASLLFCSFADADVRPEFVRVSYVSEIERNTVYNYEGAKTFQQFIFWERDDEGRRVVAWRKYDESQLLHSRGVYSELLWWDDNKLRRVLAPSSFKTWTQHDPELEDRVEFPEDFRRGL